MLAYAQTLWKAYSNTVIEGSLPYSGLLESLLTPGYSINLAAAYTTGMETMAIPGVSVDLVFNEGMGGTSYDTDVHLTNRRAPYSGAIFQRPSQTGMTALTNFEGNLYGGDIGASQASQETPGGTNLGGGDTSGMDAALGMGEGSRNPAGSSGFAGNLTEQGGFKSIPIDAPPVTQPIKDKGADDGS